jgi:hypothetical protein
MTSLSYDFRGMTVTLHEPLARHEIEREALNAQLLGAWAQANNKPGTDISDKDWTLLFQFAQLFVGVAHIEQPLPYMPSVPLPENSQDLLKACDVFWESAPKAFLVAHRAALEDAEALPDPND